MASLTSKRQSHPEIFPKKKIASIYPSGCNLSSKDEGMTAIKVLGEKKSSAIPLQGAI
jgi:hypothetical protein